KYPHELSGGMRQRVMIAQAMINSPSLLIADEPTTALDCVVQAQILELLRNIHRTKGTSILFISHDLNVVRALCSRVIVVYKGEIVEEGQTEDVLLHPKHEYTRHLVASIPEGEKGESSGGEILRLTDLNVFYDVRGGLFRKKGKKHVIHDLNLSAREGEIVGIVGESGCGKSTIAAVLTGRAAGYTGSVTIGGQELSAVNEANLLKNVTLVSLGSHLFKGTVADNLRMAAPDADDGALWGALEQVNLADFLRSEDGLNTQLAEGGSNLSGGQRQRLALARALLHDSSIYIFDEATSNIDVESENDIMAGIHRLAGRKTVILISHRLANVTKADNIYVLDHGHLAGQGTHEALLAQGGLYADLWNRQQALENYGKGAQ
ncbi:ATP-binding cassette domain-containing protein, partial [Gemmiger sp.]|uniref:ATP-binding cassette domain-containing protein n=1 Tax=Gemmiger sp. TaxID=2049027 RepID=UPI003AB1A1EA